MVNLPVAEESGEKKNITLDYGKSWWSVPHLLKLNLLLLVPITAGTLVGFDSYLINSLQMMDTWVSDMAYSSEAALGALTAGPSFGFVLTIIPARISSDRYGRKITLIVGAVILTAGVIIQSASNNYASFLVSRIICGAGLSFYLIAGPAWVAELSFPAHRTVMVTFFNSTNYVGAFISTWVAYGSFHMAGSFQWRLPCLSQLLITVPHLLFVWFIPESPRFLVYKNKVEKAREVLMRIHGGNDEAFAGAFVDQELKEISETLNEEKRVAETLNTGLFPQLFVFFKSKANFHIFAICVFVGFMQYNLGLYAISFYLDPVLETTGVDSDEQKMLIAALMALFNCVCSILTIFIVGRIGRRTLFLGNGICLLVVYVIFVVLSAINSETGFENVALARGILGMIFLCCFFYSVGFLGSLFLYVTEILPYTLRSSGLLLFTLSSQIWSIINAFVTPVGMAAISWRFYIVYACSITFCLTFIFFLFPETKGLNLEESSKIIGKHESEVEKSDVKSDVNEETIIVESISSSN